jgi:hypothetical protein
MTDKAYPLGIEADKLSETFKLARFARPPGRGKARASSADHRWPAIPTASI